MTGSYGESNIVLTDALLASQGSQALTQLFRVFDCALRHQRSNNFVQSCLRSPAQASLRTSSFDSPSHGTHCVEIERFCSNCWGARVTISPPLSRAQCSPVRLSSSGMTSPIQVSAGSRRVSVVGRLRNRTSHPSGLARGGLPFALLTFGWVSSKHSSVAAASVHELAFAVSGLLIRTRLAMRHPSLAQAAGGLDLNKAGSVDDVHSDLVVVGQPL